jgi:hypothetical protein
MSGMGSCREWLEVEVSDGFEFGGTNRSVSGGGLLMMAPVVDLDATGEMR